jgi:short-subunit dehydrogenase
VEQASERRQTALITGASAGIGRELAQVFAEHGFNLVVVARRHQELETLAGSLRADQGAEVTVIASDLTAPQAPRNLFQAIQQRGIEVDILVNNAALNFHGDFKDIALENHLELVQLNISALTALTHWYVRLMVERGHGRILNVASISAFQPIPTVAVYAASKAYVLSFSEALAVELQGTGVTVTALCPGFTDTPMLHIASATTGQPAPVPSFVVSDAAQVARAGYEACMQGKTVHVSGFTNQLASLWMQHQPRWLGRTLGGLLARWGR